MKYIQKYASIYGLDQKSGVEIVEKTPSIATQYPVMAAIGQSNNNFTTISLSRYVTAVASGKLYDYKLMNKIVDADGKTVKQYDSKSTDISGTLTQSQWDAIHQGMRMVVEDLHDVFGGFTGVEVSGKTGTAQQVETRPNHALFVGYAPSSNPEITIATRISYGYSSHNAAAASRNIISYYYNLESLDNLLAVKAEGCKLIRLKCHNRLGGLFLWSEAIVFTSGKGGVGKTTVISNIGVELSQLDKKVIMLDTDMGLRNLDLVMGIEDKVNYNILDILNRSCRIRQAIIRNKKYPNLYVIPAAPSMDTLMQL